MKSLKQIEVRMEEVVNKLIETTAKLPDDIKEADVTKETASTIAAGMAVIGILAWVLDQEEEFQQIWGKIKIMNLSSRLAEITK